MSLACWSDAPVFDVAPGNETVLEGWPMVLGWRIHGNPTPQTWWEKEGERIDTEKSTSIVRSREF